MLTLSLNPTQLNPCPSLAYRHVRHAFSGIGNVFYSLFTSFFRIAVTFFYVFNVLNSLLNFSRLWLSHKVWI